MATAGDLASQSLKMILVEAGEAPLAADDYADYLTALNQYMSALESSGIRLGYTQVTNVADAVTVPAGALRGIAANMAIEVAPNYGGKISGALLKQASDGMKALLHLSVHVGAASLPSTLAHGIRNDYYNASDFYGPVYNTVISLAGNALATDIVTSATAVKVNGFWTMEFFATLLPDITGRITNVGERFTASIAGEFTLVAAGVVTAGVLSVTRNGVIQASTTSALSTSPTTITLSTSVELEPGEYLEFVVSDTNTTYDITVTDATVRIT